MVVRKESEVGGVGGGAEVGGGDKRDFFFYILNLFFPLASRYPFNVINKKIKK